MQSTKPNDTDEIFEQFIKLVQVIRENQEIGLRVRQLLELDPYQRRTVLNNRLEQLRTQNASENLLNAHSYLFDDVVVQKVLALILIEVELEKRR